MESSGWVHLFEVESDPKGDLSINVTQFLPPTRDMDCDTSSCEYIANIQQLLANQKGEITNHLSTTIEEDP